MTNGVFDLLHYGHVRYLEAARALGDILVVAVNSDGSARRLKGAGRPLQPARDRARLLLALRSVDCVTLFDEDTAHPLLALLQPDVYVKGGDYTLRAGGRSPRRERRYLSEAATVQAYGGRVVLLPYLRGRSTSAIIERIVCVSGPDGG